jgi:hypothetical protein
LAVVVAPCHHPVPSVVSQQVGFVGGGRRGQEECYSLEKKH